MDPAQEVGGGPALALGLWQLVAGAGPITASLQVRPEPPLPGRWGRVGVWQPEGGRAGERSCLPPQLTLGCRVS